MTNLPIHYIQLHVITAVVMLTVGVMSVMARTMDVGATVDSLGMGLTVLVCVYTMYICNSFCFLLVVSVS